MRKTLTKLYSWLAPRKMAALAFDAISNPQIRKHRPHELAILEAAKQETIKFRDFDIRTYQWGAQQQEKVLLIHGWEGQAGNFSDIIRELLARNYQVLAFDGPAHGFSSRGRTSLIEFGELVGQLIRQHQCKKLISHSFGGVATTGALHRNPDLEIERYVLLTTPDKFTERIDFVSEQVGITNKVKRILIRRLEAELDAKVDTLSVSNFVQVAKVKKALILHDQNDKVIPIAQSRNVCASWSACELKVLEGTGHFRILRTEHVIQELCDFLAS